ncbi:MAG: ferrous iron transport protein A [Lachnospiraceae bacterium]|jgi:ferrous iron transport protein A|nr:ferrous iron transport protein A [Lachnospiraceae bacterium]
MRLSEAKIGQSYEVERLDTMDRVTRRLEALGLTGQTRITVLNSKKRGCMIIKVRGTRWAIGRPIAEGIQVKEAAL